MGIFEEKDFVRADFSPLPPQRRADGQIKPDEITSLPGLVAFNAATNPDHVFCHQTESHRRREQHQKHQYDTRPVTFAQLDRAIGACAAWIRTSLEAQDNRSDGRSTNVRPVALYMESDIGLFIHLAALLSLNIPALLLSARLGAHSILHLLQQTNAGTLFVTQRTETISPEIGPSSTVKIVTANSYNTFLDDNGDSRTPVPEVGDESRPGNTALILHSSGTTGLPKPIPVPHRYLLGYAACHQFSPSESPSWVNFSTLPLYHGFGLLAPALSLSVGMTCCFPPSSIIPAATSTLDILHASKATSLMTVPSILQDILSLPSAEEQTEAFSRLRKMEFVAVGGGAMNPEVANSLVKRGVRLLNHYGVTEIGAIAPIFCPTPETRYNHRYLRLRSDIGLELRPASPDSTSYRLVGYPCGWAGKAFEIQDDIELNPNCASSRNMEVRVLGRVDDVIVLKTGEKIMPRTLEDLLTANANVKTAVCVGQGRFEMAVLVEPSPSATTDLEVLRDQIWEVVLEANETLDAHARVSSKQAIIFVTNGTTVPRSDKGSVMRRETAERFRDEIDAAYVAIEADVSSENGVSFDQKNVEDVLRGLLAGVVGPSFQAESLGENEDFFERGLDSLQSLKLARKITSSLRRSGNEPQAGLTAEFVYRHPTLDLLSNAIRARLQETDSGEALQSPGHSRTDMMRALADEYIHKIDTHQTPSASKHVILMTGSTGSLGAHVLSRLSSSPAVAKIICVVRGSRAAASVSSSTENPQKTYQMQSISSAGLLPLPDSSWSKIIFLNSDSKSPLPLDSLAADITHVLHLAWPMDFQLTLPSFRAHLDLLCNLLSLCRKASSLRPTARVRMIFASSIAAVRYFNGDGPVPEGPIEADAPVKMGYAEAKWVCERIMKEAYETFRSQGGMTESVTVRIGQLSGPADTDRKGGGLWKTGEHMPVLVKACQKLGVWPDLEGTVSWLPVDHAAQALTEMLLSPKALPPFLHLENPIRQPMKDIIMIIGRELGAEPSRLDGTLIPFEEWLDRGISSGAISASLRGFFADDFRVLGQGKIVLDTALSRLVSKTLASEGGVAKDVVEGYVRKWKATGFLA
ncbi:hypothetical protein QBC40DRAFT_271190 [Triangularia verruculosa]|uniref:Carrier domain-containing protein n=1 Tax=Triangularia verruculosa TaxID=2587418 RepID=A0AAN6XRT3_9PEZI|nr:hypothetical protein QBC40DRAFT_271190 [Triangularia verruculosa]